MELDRCLRAEIEKVWVVMDAVAPAVARPRSWVSRVISFFSATVL